MSDFVSLQSSGSIPDDFTTLSTHKFEADHAENTNKEAGDRTTTTTVLTYAMAKE